MHKVIIGETLALNGKITAIELQELKKVLSLFDEPETSAIRQMGFMKDKELAEFISKAYNFQLLGKRHFDTILDEVLDLLPVDFVCELEVIPYELVGNSLKVAMENPKDQRKINIIHFFTQLKIIPCVSSRTEIMDALFFYYNYTSKETSFTKMIQAVRFGLQMKTNSATAQLNRHLPEEFLNITKQPNTVISSNKKSKSPSYEEPMIDENEALLGITDEDEGDSSEKSTYNFDEEDALDLTTQGSEDHLFDDDDDNLSKNTQPFDDGSGDIDFSVEFSEDDFTPTYQAGRDDSIMETDDEIIPITNTETDDEDDLIATKSADDDIDMSLLNEIESDPNLKKDENDVEFDTSLLDEIETDPNLIKDNEDFLDDDEISMDSSEILDKSTDFNLDTDTILDSTSPLDLSDSFNSNKPNTEGFNELEDDNIDIILDDKNLKEDDSLLNSLDDVMKANPDLNLPSQSFETSAVSHEDDLLDQDSITELLKEDDEPLSSDFLKENTKKQVVSYERYFATVNTKMEAEKVLKERLFNDFLKGSYDEDQVILFIKLKSKLLATGFNGNHSQAKHLKSFSWDISSSSPLFEGIKSFNPVSIRDIKTDSLLQPLKEHLNLPDNKLFSAWVKAFHTTDSNSALGILLILNPIFKISYDEILDQQMKSLLCSFADCLKSLVNKA